MTMDTGPLVLITLLLAVPGYAYAGYPLLLRLLALLRPRQVPPAAPPVEWPAISITLAAYNEEAQIRGLIESLLQIDYPADRRQILIVSDASTDRTDEIVAEYADRGVELLRMPARGGKGAAELAAKPHLRGEIIVNTDASIRIHPASLKPLIARFADPGVGLASGRDISVGAADAATSAGESGYVGYEMRVRKLETALGGIVGASGCFYAIRAELHRAPLPPELSRDFASALITREHGYRAVSVDEATCLVPRSGSLRREYRRKVRTMTRGLRTLFHKAHLLNPFRYGLFAWMLFSHKLCRWLVPWSLLAGLLVLAAASTGEVWARWALGGVLVLALLAGLGWLRSEAAALPRVLSMPAFALAANVAALHAWLLALFGGEMPIWEPTRRKVLEG